MLPRLKTAEQFAAVLDASKNKSAQPAGVWRSAHFVLHMAPLSALSATSAATHKKALNAALDAASESAALQEPRIGQNTLSCATVGVICPKRWAKRAVTRNTIKRQIYAVSSELQAQLPAACLVLRLAHGFSREQFISATSAALKSSVREELLGLLGKLPRAQAQTTSQEHAA